MTIAIRPPEYFPRLSYLSLAHHADRLIVADTLQYSRQSFQNRAKLRNPDGWQWISVPLEGGQHGRVIKDVAIADRGRWRAKHWRAFMYNYRSTMYFEFFEDRLRPLFDASWSRLADLTCRSVALLADLMDLDTPITRASALPGAPNSVAGIVEAVGAETLLAPPEAAAEDAPAAPHTRVLRYETPTYRQNFEGFVPGMSAADALFNYGPEARRFLTTGAHTQPYHPAASNA